MALIAPMYRNVESLLFVTALRDVSETNNIEPSEATFGHKFLGIDPTIGWVIVIKR